ncbi:hypothetical protein [Massilia sp. DD77]|uniref:hypothetical protein n=1 Tax=Massilia sp. DD77 TaxID=3109349 RepID=UPI002FFEAF18
MANAQELAARRTALVAECAAQRAVVAHEFAVLKSPETLGVVPAYVSEHKKTALIVAGVAAGFLATKPKWAVGVVTAGVSLYKFAQRMLPVLRWKGFEVH